MQVDIFGQIIVPVIGGLGIFMLGLEFMSAGIQGLAVNRMRTLLARIAGTPAKGVLAGTFITGIIQSSTAMTVMVVGLVNAGVIGLRPAISVIMGANIGTTLGNGLIALPLGPLGLLLAGSFALIYVFAKTARIRSIALACMGFALIFYGLNLMVGGLRPLRALPEVMSAISALDADSFAGLFYCVLVAAATTAMIHSSSATIGIVMGLGAAGVLDWQTAVAFALGADLGTTITSWMAALNLSRNAKRAAYAHIAFNFIGVAAMIPLFFPAMELLAWVFGWFGADPGMSVVTEGRETFPLVPVAIGLFSTAFNVLNTALLFPFIGTFERVLSRVGQGTAEDAEDFAQPRYLDARLARDLPQAVEAIRRESERYLDGACRFLDSALGSPAAPADSMKHAEALSVLDRDIGNYAGDLLGADLSQDHIELIARLIEHQNRAASLAGALHQIAGRIERQPFSPAGRALVDALVGQVADGARRICPAWRGTPRPPAASVIADLPALRERCLRAGAELSGAERGAILALLGHADQALAQARHIAAERGSVTRTPADVVGPLSEAGLVVATAQRLA